jgi:hypothetical protein
MSQQPFVAAFVEFFNEVKFKSAKTAEGDIIVFGRVSHYHSMTS